MSYLAPTLTEKFAEDVKAELEAKARADAHQVEYQVAGAPSCSLLLWRLTALVGALHAQGLAREPKKQRVAHPLPERPSPPSTPPTAASQSTLDQALVVLQALENMCRALVAMQPQEKDFVIGRLATILQFLEQTLPAAESDLRYSPSHKGKRQRRRPPPQFDPVDEDWLYTRLAALPPGTPPETIEPDPPQETRGRADAAESSTCPTVTESERKLAGLSLKSLLRNVKSVSNAKALMEAFVSHKVAQTLLGNPAREQLVASQLLGGLKEFLGKHKRKPGGQHAEADQIVSAALVAVMPDREEDVHFSAFARCLGVSRKALRRARRRRQILGSLDGLNHRPRAPRGDTRDLSLWYDFQHRDGNGVSRQDNYRPPLHTWMAVLDEHNRRLFVRRRCTPRMRDCSEKEFIAAFRKSEEYRQWQKQHPGLTLSDSLLQRHMCKCIKTNHPKECACPYHTQMAEYLSALHAARTRLFNVRASLSQVLSPLAFRLPRLAVFLCLNPNPLCSCAHIFLVARRRRMKSNVAVATSASRRTAPIGRALPATRTSCRPSCAHKCMYTS